MIDDTPEPPPAPVPPPEPGNDPAPTAAAKAGDRIAKVLARAGISSRRDAEKLIAAGRVAVNGRIIDSPALDIGPKDRVTVDGQPIPEAEPPRLWLYHKPPGLVTTEKDEEGRPTVFDNLPEGLPRVMSVGRLDITSEGLLLLTNDGEIKRRLELPSTGWLRKYRVRVNGAPDDASLEPLRQGITVDGTAYQPMQVVLDRQQGANAWLTVGLREGKNREVRRAMEAVGLTVNRLIRVSYGPFRLEELEPGQVEEVRPRVLRDQLGLEETPGAAKTGRTVRALKPVAGSAAERPAKPGFAARTGKAGWLADPSASGRPRAGTKGPGSKGSSKARPIEDKGPDDAPRPRKPAGGTGKPRAAGTRSAAADAKGGARARPAWGAASRDTPEEADAPRTRKPRVPRAGAGAGATSWDDRAPRAAAGPAGGKPAGRTFGKAPGKPWAKPAGDRGPRPARADTGDTDARATVRPARARSDERSDDRPAFPRSKGPGTSFGKGPGTGKPRPRSDGDSPDRGPRSGPRSWGTKSPATPGARGPRRDEGSGDTPRPPRAPRTGAPDKSTTDRPRSGGSSYKDVPRTGKGAPPPRGHHDGPDSPGGARTGSKPGGPRPAGGGSAGGGSAGRPFKDRAGAGPREGGPRTGGPKTGGPTTGGPTTGGPARGGPKSGGPGRSGPKAGGPKPGGLKGAGPDRGGPRGGGPRGSGPKGGGPRGGGPRGGGPRGGGPKGGGPRG